MDYEDLEIRIKKLEKEVAEKVSWFSLISIMITVSILAPVGTKIVEYLFR